MEMTSNEIKQIIREELEIVLSEKKKKGGKICQAGKDWAKRTFDTYPSAYANLAASKYCKDPNYAKASKKRSKSRKKNEELELEEGELKKWLDQDWVRITSSGKIAGKCGTSKSKKNPDRCLPRSKAKSLTKSQRAATARKKKKAQKTGKDSGKTSYVSNTRKGKVTKSESLNEDYSPHDMFDPKTGKKIKTKVEKDHLDLAKKGYVHVDPKDIEKILDDEGGAAGLDPFLDELGKDLEDDILKALKNMPNVGKHKKGDYILSDDAEIKIMKEATYEDGSPVEENFGFYETLNEEDIEEAIYKGKTVKLNKPMRGDVKKFKVYVNSGKKDSKGRIKAKKVNFGHGGSSAKKKGEKTMRIRRSNPKARRNFRKRHNCDNPGPKTKARYWSCRKW